MEATFSTVRWFLSSIFTTIFIFSCLFFLVSVSAARDTMTFSTPVRDDKQSNLVSAGETFELGFFTPNGSSDDKRRYVGIWYYDRTEPPTVVWVANRDREIPNRNGVLKIAEDGNLKVMVRDEPYWTADIQRPLNGIVLKLMDNGNLILIKEGDQDKDINCSIWQSFNFPTDTFLPGMKMVEGLKLTSWIRSDDPAPGKFTFEIDGGDQNQYIINDGIDPHWKSNIWGTESVGIPFSVLDYLSNFTYLNNSRKMFNNFSPQIQFNNPKTVINNSRIVMNYDGQIQFLSFDIKTNSWSKRWYQPKGKCDLANSCGQFASCNSENRFNCKCLPGFIPKSRENWNKGDFQDGCTRKSELTCRNDSDNFLVLRMMEMRKPHLTWPGKGEACKKTCLEKKCKCLAYSESGPESRDSECRIWEEDDEIKNIRESLKGTIYVRVPLSDTELTSKDCPACGTDAIPYPLSNGDCGDPKYQSFFCNTTSAQLYFQTDDDTFYRVTIIVPDNRTFSIKVNKSECDDKDKMGKFLQVNQSSPFFVSKVCTGGWSEVEIGWMPPLEPICTSSDDCKYWSNSICTVTKDGTKRCLCESSFQWNGTNINCTRGVSNFHKGNEGDTLRIIVPVAVATLVVIFCFTFFMFYLRRMNVADTQDQRRNVWENQAFRLYDNEKRVKDFINSRQFGEDDKKQIDVPFFDLDVVLAATDNFSEANKLGQGGFGPVYKGTFPGGQEIAIKMLSRGSGQGLEEFKNEVMLIAKLQHRNLVRLLGYCVEGEEKMLLYEYMPNKSLDSFIFDRTLCLLLNWEIRFNIILGIARGLLYLHQDSRLRIIHRDLKTSNVLLDEEMNPKISDFGLARILGGKETEASTVRVVGTYGYMSPEYALEGLFSEKSDVFSFGVVILEIVSGKRNTGFYMSEQALSLLGYAWRLWCEGKAIELMDPILRENCNSSEFLKCVNIGLLCVQDDLFDRPNMSNVVYMLGSDHSIVSLPRPKQPAFVIRRSLTNSTTASSSKPEISREATLEEGR